MLASFRARAGSVARPPTLPAALMTSARAASTFHLPASFVADFRKRAPPFGFHGLGEMVFHTRYARVRPDGTKEQWADTLERVVNGTFRMQQRHLRSVGAPWDESRARADAEDMFSRMWDMRFLPPGRGLWAMGSPLTEERHVHAALHNCGFVSTRGMGRPGADPTEPFAFLMDASMLGVGTGFDVAGAMEADAPVVTGARAPAAGGARIRVPDSREGWVDSVRTLLHAHFRGDALPAFDYSAIRPAGSPIRGFGGTASGPDVLRQLHESIDAVLAPLAGKRITVTAIADIFNLIGRAVTAGGARQTAEIALGPPSAEFLALKDYAANPQRAAWGWTSNNSVVLEGPAGMGAYDGIAQRIRDNGEPGLLWLHNARRYGRMGQPPDNKDWRAVGTNPCGEQTLESFELCCLVETFPARHSSLDDYKRTLEVAFQYAKTVTLGRTHWPATNAVLMRNRRIGCSVSGVAQFIAQRGLPELQQWLEEGYGAVQAADERYSGLFGVPRSIKTTSVKPSGTVSLLAGATPGMHFPESRYYIRRVRLRKDHELVPSLVSAGFHVEPALEDPDRKVVVAFPVDVGEGVRTLEEVPMWEQLSLAALLQRVWADNQVSCTVTFDPAREGAQIPAALEHAQLVLKGVAFLPRAPLAAYPQLPYQSITAEEYAKATVGLRSLSTSALKSTAPTEPERFCDSDVCVVLGAAEGDAAAGGAAAAGPASAGGRGPSASSSTADSAAASPRPP